MNNDLVEVKNCATRIYEGRPFQTEGTANAKTGKWGYTSHGQLTGSRVSWEITQKYNLDLILLYYFCAILLLDRFTHEHIHT